MSFVTRLVRATAALFPYTFSPVRAAENGLFERDENPNGNTFILLSSAAS